MQEVVELEIKGGSFLNIELEMGNMCPCDMDTEKRAAEIIEMIVWVMVNENNWVFVFQMSVSVDAMLNSTLEDKYFGSYSGFWVNKVSVERD